MKEINPEELIHRILENFSMMKSDEIPSIPLYMDQVTTFMDERLSHSKRDSEEKVLTKTMINNYAKNKLFPSPEKKRYTREHLILLTFIYYFKNVMSISDIKTVLGEISENYFSEDAQVKLTDIFDEIVDLSEADLKNIQKSVEEKGKLVMDSFPEADSNDQKFLQLFAFICLLNFDVYIKKQMIEGIVDEINLLNGQKEEASDEKKEKPKKEKNKKD